MHAKKHNARNQSYSLRALRFPCACVAVFFISVAWPACVASIALRMAAWKPTFKSVTLLWWVSGSCGFQVVVRNTCNTTDATQWTHGLRHNQKPKYTTHAHEKQPMYWFVFACAALFVCIHCVCCIQQLGNRPLCLFSAFWWQRLCLDIRHVYVNPWQLNSCFMMDEQFVKLDDWRWSTI